FRLYPKIARQPLIVGDGCSNIVWPCLGRGPQDAVFHGYTLPQPDPPGSAWTAHRKITAIGSDYSEVEGEHRHQDEYSARVRERSAPVRPTAAYSPAASAQWPMRR